MKPRIHLSLRRSGILLHPTSLPGPYGIGDLGPEAHRFLGFLKSSGQSWWQMFPLGPPGLAYSPYQVHSAFAGNRLLISLDFLYQDGLLSRTDIQPLGGLAREKVDFGAASRFKEVRFRRAYQFFLQTSGALKSEFDDFRHSQRDWLDSAALYFALKSYFKGAGWTRWPRGLRLRRPAVLRQWRGAFQLRVGYQEFLQFVFYRQWEHLRKACAKAGVGVIGDLPIFIAHDSADVWAHPHLFYLDKKGNPLAVAGTPPDYFSRTGQRWGNPLYRWNVMKKDGYGWWMKRLDHTFRWFDAARLDHFIGFQRYWRIPAADRTAKNGRWCPGPGADIFQTARRKLGPLPIIAEDLGAIGPDVEALRDRFHFPGMKVLQFAFSGEEGANPFLPDNFTPPCVVYTGTHDNDTTVGWFNEKSTQKSGARDRALAYLRSTGKEIHWDMIRLAHLSMANLAVVPAQDLLGLPAFARMNTPGTIDGNWTWRMKKDALNDKIKKRLLDLTRLSGRLPSGN